MVIKIKLILEQLKGMNFHAKASYRAIVMCRLLQNSPPNDFKYV